MTATGNTQRRLSSLQKKILILLAALDEHKPGPVATRDLEKLLADSGDRPVYGPNLRESCKRMETSGLLRTLRSCSLHLAVELTEAGRNIAEPLLVDERKAYKARQRLTEVRVLPVRELGGMWDREVEINNIGYTACRGDFVVRLDGTTCLQLWSVDGRCIRLEGDALDVATWYQCCHDAGLPGHVQVNESQVIEHAKLAK
ncbi:hypothetical protein [Serratia fonticola]